MKAETEKADALTTGTQGGANSNAETVICGPDGRVIVTFFEPAPTPVETVQVTPGSTRRLLCCTATLQALSGYPAARRQTTLADEQEVCTMIAKILTWLETDLAQNITGLLVAAALLLLFS